MLSAGDDREQPWLDLVNLLTGSRKRLWVHMASMAPCPIHRATEALFL